MNSRRATFILLSLALAGQSDRSMLLYRIKDWEGCYEIGDAAKIAGPLKWVATPTKHEGVGFRRVVAQRDRSDLFAGWNLIIQIAAKLPRARRGMLVDSDGTPLDAEALSLKTGWPEVTFGRVLTFFSDPKQGWLTVTEVPDQSAPTAAPTSNGGSAPEASALSTTEAEPIAPPRGNPRKSADVPGGSSATGQDRTTKETSSPPPKAALPTSEGQRFVLWFVELLEVTGAKPSLTPNVKESWAECYDKMLRLDGRTKDEIKEVCRWARDDAFWRKNFLSPMKLREKKDGISYFDQFVARMSTDRPRAGRPAPDIYVEPQNWRERAAAKWPGVTIPDRWSDLSATLRNDLVQSA